MKRAIDKSMWKLTVFCIILAAYIIGYITAPKTEPISVVKTIPKDMFIVKFSDVGWHTEPLTRCWVNDKMIRNGSVFLFIENSTGETKRTEEAIYFAPLDIKAYPDIYPYEVIYLDKVTGKEYLAENYCHTTFSFLNYKKTLIYANTTVFEEFKKCEIDFYGSDALIPGRIEYEIKKCFDNDN